MPVAYFWPTEVPRKVSRHSESGGRSWPAPPPKAIAHPFLWAFSAGRTWRPGLRMVIFCRGCVRGLFLGAAVPVAYFWPTEVPRKVSHHSESGGRSWPAPPPKAIAHPFLWPFSAGRTWRHGLRAVIFWRGFARGLCLTHGGSSQCLAAFRVWRTKWASPPPKAIAHPFLWPFCAGRTWRPSLRVVIFGRGFVHSLCLAHGGPSQRLAVFRVRRTKWASPTPPRL